MSRKLELQAPFEVCVRHLLMFFTIVNVFPPKSFKLTIAMKRDIAHTIGSVELVVMRVGLAYRFRG